MKISGAIIFFPLVIMGSAQAASVSLNVTPSELYKDHQINISIAVDPQSENIAGVELDIEFDDSRLQSVSVREGNLLNQNSANTFFKVLCWGNNSISNIVGVILGNSSVMTPNIFTSITFRATNTGNAFIELKNIKISDPAGNLLNVAVPNRTILQIISDTAGYESTGSAGSNIGSGGGNGGGGISDEKFTNIELKEKYDLFINKDTTTSYGFRNISNPIVSINITGNTNAGEINTAVEVLRNTSSLVKTSASGIVYRNINIWVGTYGFATPKNIKHAEITFRVPKSWIEANSIDSDSINMARYHGTWQSLPTQKISEDAEYLYFEATTNSFSPFAVVGKGSDIQKLVYQTQGAYSSQQVIKVDETVINVPGNQDDLSIFLLIGAIVGGIVNAALIYKIRKARKSIGSFDHFRM